jgi:CDP-diacylglycerol---glycerol-3-phosphate 3-phosphatidyltransferase
MIARLTVYAARFTGKSMSSQNHNLKPLHRQWGGIALISIPVLAGFYFWVQSWWAPDLAGRWIIGTTLTWGYLLFVLRKDLRLNYRQIDATHTLLPNLGIGNLISIFRGLILAILGGFILVPRPEGVYAILPSLLYTLGALPDFLDGYLARITNHVTKLGENLDLVTDSVGLLIATLVGARHGQVPAWYVLLGLARYLFLAGMWLRTKRGLPNHDMPFSVRRRGLAGLQMGFVFVILWPQFQPPAAHIAAYCFGIPFLLSFLWDWFVVSGVISPTAWPRTALHNQFFVQWLPLILRVSLIAFIIPQLTPLNPSPLTLIIPLITTLLLVFGLLGRLTAIVALIALGLAQLTAPLTYYQLTLIPVYVALLTLGTGKFSLWPLEDGWIYHRAGERQ